MRKLKLLMAILSLLISIVSTAQAQSIGYSQEKGAFNLCNRTFENYKEATEMLSSELKLQNTDEMFTTYRDDKKHAIWYLTSNKNDAHPSVICQQLRKVNGKAMMATEVNCTADKAVCDHLTQWFSERASLLMKKANEK